MVGAHNYDAKSGGSQGEGKGRQYHRFSSQLGHSLPTLSLFSHPPTPPLQNYKVHRIKEFQEFCLMMEFHPLFIYLYFFSFFCVCIHSYFQLILIFNKVGDPVLLVFDNGARGFLSLPKPLFGSECDDNNPAGTF